MKYAVVSLVALIAGCSGFSALPHSSEGAGGGSAGAAGSGAGSGGQAGSDSGGSAGQAGSGGSASGGTESTGPGAAFAVDAAEPLVTHELGIGATFTVSLTARPTGDVTVAVSSNDATEATTSPETLTFTIEDWNVAQTVTVTGVPEAGLDGNVDFAVELRVSASDDDDYGALLPVQIWATNHDWAVERFVANPLGGDMSGLRGAGVSNDGALLAFVRDGEGLVWDPRSGTQTRFGTTVESGYLSGNGLIFVYTELGPFFLGNERRRLKAARVSDGGVESWLAVSGDSTIDSVVVSVDAEFVAFASDADNIALGAPNGGAFVADTRLASFQPRRVDADTFGAAALSSPEPVGISRDGRIVAMVAAIESQEHQAFVADGGELRAISVDANGAWANRDVSGSELRLSTDGSTVVFSTDATNLATSALTGSAIYTYDVASDELEPLKTTDGGALTGQVSAVSRDGSLVAFGGFAGGNSGDEKLAVFVLNASNGFTYRVDLSDLALPLTESCFALSVSNDQLVMACDDGNQALDFRYLPLGDAFWNSPLVPKF